jgi:hypothetical protein
MSKALNDQRFREMVVRARARGMCSSDLRSVRQVLAEQMYNSDNIRTAHASAIALFAVEDELVDRGEV